MPTIYQTRDGDVLDAICALHYGTENLSYSVTQVLEANQGWRITGGLPFGLLITLPDLALPVEDSPFSFVGLIWLIRLHRLNMLRHSVFKAEGRDITHALQQSLAELTLTDYGGATAKADELKITLLSETLALPTKGGQAAGALGFNNHLVDKLFVVSGVASSGPPRRIEIYATAAPMNAQKQPVM
ncbi:tail protein X [Citrobacter koseri]|uniref:tail protein X n=1 Tax=Citrobacter koseri TaxID=545 RepID=UPI000AC1FE99|nr:tail protein X [Citrobacter koseri]